MGGLPDVTDEEFKSYWEQYGALIQCSVIKDESGRCKGYGFVTFDSVAAVKTVLAGSHEFRGKSVDVKFANGPKPRLSQQQMRGMPQPGVPNPMMAGAYNGMYGGGGIDRTVRNPAFDWDCPKCGNLNYSFRFECKKCQFPRPPQPAAAAQGMGMGMGGMMMNPMMMNPMMMNGMMMNPMMMNQMMMAGGGGTGGGGGGGGHCTAADVRRDFCRM